MSSHRGHPRRIGPLCCLALVAAAIGCAITGERGQALVPTQFLTRMGPYRIWTHAPVPEREPILRPLGELERQLQAQLAVHVNPDETPIDIYILKDQTEFEHLLMFYYPELPARRAFFLAQGNRRLVYTYQGDHLIEDLRHEVTHALLHASVSNLPLWLDEGLAEYFEVGDENGLNREHLDRLRSDLAAGWKPDLGRLEGVTDVRRMSARNYREAWAWTHYLLRSSSQEKTELLAYLADLRGDPKAAPLSARLQHVAADGSERLAAHVASAGTRAVATAPTAANRALVVRGQDSPIEPARPARKRRTILGKFLDSLGF